MGGSRIMKPMSVRCCIAGGGPAGMMLGLLLARAGVNVVVLEKHVDFLRDFRGDTIHPSTLEVMHELGLLERLLTLPHQKVSRINGQFGDLALTVADFSFLSTHCRFIAFMPQWDFLNFLAEEAARYSTFQLRRQADVTGLIEESGSVVGLQANTPDGPFEVRADLVVGADGRHSIVRAKAGLSIEEFGAPMDVLWFRLSRRASDPADPIGRFDAGRIFIMLNRGDYWQCGFVIPKGSRDQLQGRGLPAFRDAVAQLTPFMADRVGELQDWEPIKLLTVQVDRLRRWYRPGLLCIGDAAHAMSPAGGVGINLAIQDAVATANLLTAPLCAGQLTIQDLQRVQQRREWPTRMTQRVQLMIQNRVIKRVLTDRDKFSPPFAIRLLALLPFLRRIPARMIGLGFRPEHVHTSVAKTAHASAEVVSP
jgi:2-polyprenyl-6-methoxyphenol hydroxylase-like FAD-dependent oxidoreductase